MKRLATTALVSALALGIGSMAHADYDPALAGGTLRMVASQGSGTIDPHINYTSGYWNLFQATYDGLIAFQKANGADGFVIVPNLAEAIPEATNDGKTYVFQLRKGIKFSNGKDVDVNDVVASLQRLFKVSSPTSGSFYNIIVGADACLATPATCTLEGGVVADAAAGTVTINLTRPDPEFLYKLAVPHAVILPADSPAEDVGTQPLPGTGTYVISSYDPNKGIVLTRNPHFTQWSEAAQPTAYPDEVRLDFGLSGDSQVTEIQQGRADWMSEPPIERLGELGRDYAAQVNISPLTAWWYAPLNTRIPPFDSEPARQALAYAVNRDALVSLFGGPNLATPVCQVLPEGFPGHEPYCPFTKDPDTVWSAPDMEKALALVEQSGTKGQEVTVVADDTNASTAVGTYLQSVLSDLGYDAKLKVLSSDIQFTYVQNSNNKVQISVSQWYQDYPAASDFLYVLFGCDSFRPGSDSSINMSAYCDKTVDDKMKAALTLGITDEAAANKLWAEIDRDVTDTAAAVGLFAPKKIDFVSKRLKNYKYNSQIGFMFQLGSVQ